jgi:uroporphyrinogen-III synthase
VIESGQTVLAGKRIVVTRAAAQAIDLLKALQYAGAVPILLPVIQILPPEDFTALDEALRRLGEFDWILFTSQNAVRIVHERLELSPPETRSSIQTLLAGAVGQSTATEAASAGFRVAHVASRPLGLTLAQELGSCLHEKKVFLPRSDRANPDMIVTLEKFGAIVTEVVAYRTLAAEAQDRDVVSKAMNADAVLFFSPSAVEGFDSVCGEGRLAEFSAKGVVLASGPVTLAALQTKGILNAGAAKEPSVARIIEALANSFTARQRQSSSRAGTQ